MENFITVGEQVIVLFILVLVGYACGRFKIFGERMVKEVANVVLYFATPCVIIQSFQRELRPELLTNLLVTALIALAIHVGTILLATLLFRDNVLRYGVVFSNAGYMGLPLQQALLGSEGVFYGAIYVAVFNVVQWTWGLWQMSDDRKTFSVRKLLTNPGLIGVLVGLLLFVFSIRLPNILLTPIGHLAALNTPLPMLLVGFYLSRSSLLDALRDRKALSASLTRIVLVPLLSLGIMYLCGVRGNVLVACTIAVSAPTAAATSMFAAKFDRDVKRAVNMIAITTIASVITMPLIVGLGKYLM